ncbi:CPBP family intramembrane glutamic endopeptidase [Nannocystis bainbridge]|uniref:CPBP family intramembrane metalloprotease n=1 Tax=Nannocystis bainbridge TaxID=2995303 RepID=A0ABT5E4J1_9BACT|nr:CPBP family intramembrane glutamic endopeptidase [Nannocystis bainbridge]MDC0720756.1 CPBP family intramembrane metalloprotease [Nannocystis bainbridge]
MSPAATDRISVIASEIVTAVGCFAAGLVLILGIPGVADGLRAAFAALFGQPVLPPDQAKIALSMALTPIATLCGAFLYDRLGRLFDPGPLPPLVPAAQQPRLPRAATISLVYLCTAVVGSYALGFLMQLLGAPIAEQRLVLDLVAAGGPALASLVFSALALAPLGEELFFRGLVFRRIAHRAGMWPALVTSSLLFAVFHGNLQGLVVYLWLGLVFAGVYAATGRLSCAVAVHFGNNAITLLTLLAPRGDGAT